MNRGARDTAEQLLHTGRTGDTDTVLHLMAPDGGPTTHPAPRHGTVGRTGATFDQRVIAVLRIRHGQVLTYRDYINPQPLMEALNSGGERHR